MEETSLADPTEDTDGINGIFISKTLNTVTKNIKSEISTSISDLTKTNNEKVSDLETKITRGATYFSEIQKIIANQKLLHLHMMN